MTIPAVSTDPASPLGKTRIRRIAVTQNRFGRNDYAPDFLKKKSQAHGTRRKNSSLKE